MSFPAEKHFPDHLGSGIESVARLAEGPQKGQICQPACLPTGGCVGKLPCWFLTSIEVAAMGRRGGADHGVTASV